MNFFSFRLPSGIFCCAVLCQCTTSRLDREVAPAAPAAPAAASRTWAQVCSRLAAAVPEDRKGNAIAWKFSVREAPGTNATSWPDGRIEITSGTLGFVKNEGELAAIAAHEMAHVYCRHGRRRAVESWVNFLGGGAVAALMVARESDPGTAVGIASGAVIAVSLTILTARQRAQEYEADQVSLRFLSRCGYPPQAAVDFWERYAINRAGLGFESGHWWQDHPPDEIRVQRLQALASAQ